MYVNRADFGNPHEEFVNHEVPLFISSVGQYRLKSIPVLHTQRLEGRSDYQLIYIAAGTGTFLLNGRERVLEKGKAVLFRPGIPQDYTFRLADCAEFFWCHFTGSQVEQILSDCGIDEGTMVFSAGVSSDYQWLFLQMIREIQMKMDKSEEIALMNLRHILLLIARQQMVRKDVGNKMLGEIENAIRHMNLHYYWKIEMKEYAENHLMTPYWFSQNFKKVTGSSPTQYLISIRMANAMNLLDNTNQTVAQVAAAVGYENTQYFHRLFHKHTGMTPKEYKERIK